MHKSFSGMQDSCPIMHNHVLACKNIFWHPKIMFWRAIMMSWHARIMFWHADIMLRHAAIIFRNKQTNVPAFRNHVVARRKHALQQSSFGMQESCSGRPEPCSDIEFSTMHHLQFSGCKNEGFGRQKTSLRAWRLKGIQHLHFSRPKSVSNEFWKLPCRGVRRSFSACKNHVLAWKS